MDDANCMGKKMVPKLILEGTRLTHKTDLAFALNEHPRIVGVRKYRHHSPVISAEWCGLTPQPWGRGLINYAPEEEEGALETYRTWIKLMELQRYYSWIIDRFHLSTKLHQRLYNARDVDFDWLERRLVALNYRLVYIHRHPGSFAEARRKRLEVSGNPAQYDDLQRFVVEQAHMEALVWESTLQTLRVDISDDDVDAAADRIADWMEETGGLFLED